MNEADPKWDEAASDVYRKLLTIAVPDREEQIAVLLSLLPCPAPSSGAGVRSVKPEFKIVELGCGTGTLSFAFLDQFPSVELWALDGSRSMREKASRTLNRFGDRVRVLPFELTSNDWHPLLDEADAVVSSLCLHHLTGEGKRKLFSVIQRRLSAEGAFLVADLVAPQQRGAKEVFQSSWDLSAEVGAKAAGSPELYRSFCEEEWNVYRFPDPVDHPSPLSSQLSWLSEAGFKNVDCFWLRAGHAVYGGFKEERSFEPLPFRQALLAARSACEATM